MAHVVVVGAGLAGARTCAALRDCGFAGRITLMGAQAEPPYDRPPLTKQPGAEVDLRPAMGLDVWDLADEVLLGTPARGLLVNADSPVVVGPGGALAADAVVLATGAEPILPPGWAAPGVQVLGTRAEADRFWAAARPGVRIVIVGGGWIGCEAAAGAAGRGAEVTLLEAGDRLLAGRVPAGAAERVGTWLAGAGVRVRVGDRVTGIDSQGAGGLVVRGEALGAAGAARVLVGLGVRPATGWLAGCGVDLVDGAVRTDAWGRTTVPGVFAVGDVATRWSPRDRRLVPGGHWTEALNAPTTVGPAVAEWVAGSARGGRAVGEAWRAWQPGVPAHDPVPYVFSDIAGRHLQVLGEAVGARVVERGAGEAWTSFVLDADDRLVGACGVGRPRDIAAARRAILADPLGLPGVDPRALADPGAPAAAMFPDAAGVRAGG